MYAVEILHNTTNGRNHVLQREGGNRKLSIQKSEMTLGLPMANGSQCLQRFRNPSLRDPMKAKRPLRKSQLQYRCLNRELLRYL